MLYDSLLPDSQKSPFPPTWRGPPDPGKSGKSAHFVGYLITLPVGTKFFTFFSVFSGFLPYFDLGSTPLIRQNRPFLTIFDHFPGSVDP